MKPAHLVHACRWSYGVVVHQVVSKRIEPSPEYYDRLSEDESLAELLGQSWGPRFAPDEQQHVTALARVVAGALSSRPGKRFTPRQALAALPSLGACPGIT